MAETADPVRALSARDIPTRAAGARDLALVGTLEHVPTLLTMSLEDRSPGVRLHCAGAAADILSRYRSAEALPPERRTALYEPIAKADPGFNPALFQVASELATPACVSRILGGMRDPRVDVRQGACVGLLRLCQQGSRNGDAELERSVVALLSDPRIKPDTRVEIARICSWVGYSSALPVVEGFAGLGPKLEELAQEAAERLRNPGRTDGIWVEAGRDAGELVARNRTGLAAALVGSHLVLASSPVAETKVGGIRLLFIKERGWDSADRALQVGDRTFHPGDPDDVAALADAILASNRMDLETAVVWPDTAAGRRARGSFALQHGRVEEALSLLQEAVDLKKVPADTWWWLAEALRLAGREEEGRPHLEKYVAKASKRSPWLAEAKRRLESTP